ncbi:hydroxyacid dehydrogenase [Mucilaginibacter sp. PPCGB 2223]|uniref:2-hydroxyacid dehydrogenase n=1 Tax=Mucilaginibacter sp. PPCGB 2223 TaxID=1886027 RepID=UPI0008249E80|nr:2-hydroxyacid dehydrogenase [Mucilaginibacter sp. PPCGB 2223]OCX50494.1 hydroxyacid dehydrogenase [Mucilaginibacter sp. PPCGB 2223]
MKVAVFSTHKFERDYLISANNNRHELKFLESVLSEDTADLAAGHIAVSIFVNDHASAPVLEKLKKFGVNFLVLRCAGFNNVDLQAASRLGLRIARVPDYSPHAIAEHTIALILALNRKLVRAHNRIMEQNFSLDGLVGFDTVEKTVGIIGTGKIGALVAKIMHGFGCRILAFDPVPDESLVNQFHVTYTDCDTLCRESDIITLHAPLTEASKYLIDSDCIATMKKGVMLINTSRGKLVNTKAVIDGLKDGKIGYFGMDVYEEEDGLFFEDHSEDILLDDTIARLMVFQNVLITSHQAFLTETALRNIADATVYNIDCFENGSSSGNEILSYGAASQKSSSHKRFSP